MKQGRTQMVLAIAALLVSSGVFAAENPQQQAWRILRAGARDKSAETRALAVGKLGLTLHDSRAATMAEKALEDDKPEVRAAGARALGQMHSAKAIPKLRKALRDKEHSVVMAAAHSLVLLNDPDGYELYYSVLTGEEKKGQDLISHEMEDLDDPRKVAEFSFEEGIGLVPYGGYGLTAVDLIKKQKEDKDRARAAAARVLATDPDPQSRDALVRAASDKSWIVRVAALEAIAKRADPSLLSQIQGAVSDENDHVRYTAAAAIIRLADMRSTKQEARDCRIPGVRGLSRRILNAASAADPTGKREMKDRSWTLERRYPAIFHQGAVTQSRLEPAG